MHNQVIQSTPGFSVERARKSAQPLWRPKRQKEAPHQRGAEYFPDDSVVEFWADMESATAFDRAPQHEPGFSNGLSVSKTGNAAVASEASAPLRSGGNSAALISLTAG